MTVAANRPGGPVTWYLSFADPDLPKGTQFLGGAYIEMYTDNIALASTRAWELGINPGGEMMGLPMPGHGFVPRRYLNQLLSKAALDAMDTELFGETIEHPRPGAE